MKKSAVEIVVSCAFAVGVLSCGAAADTKNTASLARIKPVAASETKCEEEKMRATCIESSATVGNCTRWGLAGCGAKTIWKLEENDVWVCESSGTKVIPPEDVEKQQKQAARDEADRAEAEAEAAKEAEEKAAEAAEETAAAEEKAAKKADKKEKTEAKPAAPVDDVAPGADEEIPEPVPVEL